MNDAAMSQKEEPWARIELVARAIHTRDALIGEAQKYLIDPGESEDVVQELFLLLSKFDGIRPRSLDAWLRQIVRRRSLDVLRRRIDRSLVLDLESDQARRTILIAPEDLSAALSNLREPYRSAIELRYMEGLSFSELAEALDSRERTARTWVSRGLAALRLTLRGMRP